MGKGDRREGGGGRRPEQGGGDTTDGRSPGGPGNPATPRAPRGRAPSRRALGRPPCPGRRGDPRTDLGQGGSRTRQGGTPGVAAGTPSHRPEGAQPPVRKELGSPSLLRTPQGRPEGPQLKSQPPLSPAQPLWDAAFWGGRGPPQHLECSKRVRSVLTVGEIKKKQ